MRPDEVLENPLPTQLAPETVIMAPTIAVNHEIAVNDSSTEAVQTVTTNANVQEYSDPTHYSVPIVIPVANSGNATFGGYPIMTDPQSLRVEFEVELAELDMKRWIPNDEQAGLVVNGFFDLPIEEGWQPSFTAPSSDVAIVGGACQMTSESLLTPARLRSLNRIIVVPDQEYTVTFDVTGDDLDNSEVFTYSVGTIDEDDASYYSTEDSIITYANFAGKKTLTFTAPHLVSEVYLHFKFAGVGAHTHIITIDNIEMGRPEGLELSGVAGVPWSGTDIPVTNGTFYNGGTNWTLTEGDGSIDFITANAPTFPEKCYITNGTSSPVSMISDAITVMIGLPHTVSFWCAAQSSNLLRFGAAEAGSDNLGLYDSSSEGDYIPIGPHWHSFTFTPLVSSIAIQFLTNLSAGPGLLVYLDDVTIASMTMPALIPVPVTNGDFSEPLSPEWASVPGTGTVTIVNGQANMTAIGDLSTMSLFQVRGVEVTIGRLYRASFDCYEATDDFRWGITGATSFSDYDSDVTTSVKIRNGSNYFDFVATAAFVKFQFELEQTNGARTVAIDNVAVNISPINHINVGDEIISGGAVGLTSPGVIQMTNLVADDIPVVNGEFTAALPNGWTPTTAGVGVDSDIQVGTVIFTSGVNIGTNQLVTKVSDATAVKPGYRYVVSFTRSDSFSEGYDGSGFRFGSGYDEDFAGDYGTWGFFNSGEYITPPVIGLNRYMFQVNPTWEAPFLTHFIKFDASECPNGTVTISDVSISETFESSMTTQTIPATANTLYKVSFEVASSDPSIFFEYLADGAGDELWPDDRGILYTSNTSYLPFGTIQDYPMDVGSVPVHKEFYFIPTSDLLFEVTLSVNAGPAVVTITDLKVEAIDLHFPANYLGVGWIDSSSSDLATAHNIQVGSGGSDSYVTTPLRINRNLPANMNCFMGASGDTVGGCEPSGSQQAMYEKQGGDAYYPPSCSAFPTRLEPFEWVEISFPFSDNAKTIRINDPARIKTFFNNIVKQKDRKINFESTKWNSKFKRLNSNKLVPTEDLTYDKDPARYAAGEWFEDLAVGDTAMYTVYVADMFEEFDKKELMYLPNITLTFQPKANYRQLFVKHIAPECSITSSYLPKIVYPDTLVTDIQSPNALAVTYVVDDVVNMDAVDTVIPTVNTVTGSHWNINGVSCSYETYFSRRITTIPQFFNAFQRFTLNSKTVDSTHSGDRLAIKTTHFGAPKGLFIFPETINDSPDTQTFFNRRWKTAVPFQFRNVRMNVDGARYPTNEIYKSYNMDTFNGDKREYLAMMRKVLDVSKVAFDEFDPHTERHLPLLYIPLDAVVRDMHKANENILGNIQDRNVQYDFEIQFGTTNVNAAWSETHNEAMRNTKFIIAFVQDHSCRSYGNRFESTAR